MKALNITLAAFTIAALHAGFGCSPDRSSDQAPGKTRDTPHKHEVAHDRSHAPSEVGLSLNDGAKWELDAHTKDVMSKIVAVVEVAPPSEPAVTLGTRLDELTQQLIRGCTMTGPPHDQLHVFLVKWLPAVERLKTVEAPESEAAIAEVRALLATFDQHFL